MQEEIWKPIEGYEGYEVSSEGRIKSLHRDVVGLGNNQYSQTEMILKPNLNNSGGYQRVGLYKNGVLKMFLVHRLVAEAFLPNPDNLPQVNHINEFDKTDNRVSNLEWMSAKDNMNYGTRTQRSTKKRLNHQKLSNEVYQYSTDGEFIKAWSSTRECGRNGFDQGHVAACCNGKRKKHKGFLWSYTPLEAS